MLFVFDICCNCYIILLNIFTFMHLLHHNTNTFKFSILLQNNYIMLYQYEFQKYIECNFYYCIC